MIRKTIEFLYHLINNRNLLYELTKRNLVQQYRSSLLGVFWAVIEPIIFMLLLAFVFDIGLKAGKLMEVPFVVYLLTGMSIFFLFSGVLGQGPTIINSHAYLLNKVSFRVEILPLINIFSQTITHFFTLFPVILILLYFNISPSWYWLQSIYYLVSLIFLLLGIVLLTSAVGIFIPDINNIVSLINRFLLYLSPVFWDINQFPPHVQFFLKLNPMYYIVSGYRDSFLFHKGFWTHPMLSFYYWSVSLTIFVIGALIFKKFKPYFSDFV